MNRLPIVKESPRKEVDVNAIVEDIVKEEKRKGKSRKLFMRQCICGHTGQRHINIERFEILKKRDKSPDEIANQACADCNCQKFVHPERKECKCGHDIKYHKQKMIEFNGKMIETFPCKYAKCEHLCKTFKPKIREEISKEEMRAINKEKGLWFSPEVIEERSNELDRLIAESEKENLEDLGDEI